MGDFIAIYQLVLIGFFATAIAVASVWGVVGTIIVLTERFVGRKHNYRLRR
jgi:hypothetical protein